MVVTGTWNDKFYLVSEQMFCYKFSYINSDEELTHVNVTKRFLLSEDIDPSLTKSNDLQKVASSLKYPTTRAANSESNDSRQTSKVVTFGTLQHTHQKP